ncbi:hypothetical protein ACJX0J_007274, partial [Zea mays]
KIEMTIQNVEAEPKGTLECLRVIKNKCFKIYDTNLPKEDEERLLFSMLFVHILGQRILVHQAVGKTMGAKQLAKAIGFAEQLGCLLNELKESLENKTSKFEALNSWAIFFADGDFEGMMSKDRLSKLRSGENVFI